MVKICAAANNLDTHIYFGISGRYSTGETPPIKAERSELSALGVYMSERI